MFSTTIQDNSMNLLNRIQERMLFNCKAAAETYREAVKLTLGTDAFDPKEHAQSGYPPMRHTGDLQKSIHYAGGIEAGTGDIIFLVFSIAQYANDWVEPHPFLENVFENFAADVISIMTAPLNVARPSFNASAYMVNTQSYIGRGDYDHNYYEVFPTLPTVTRAFYTF